MGEKVKEISGAITFAILASSVTGFVFTALAFGLTPMFVAIL